MSESLMERLDQVAVRVQSASQVLVFSDFDGTLVPICSHPDQCVLHPEVGRTLARLLQLPRVVFGVVSGRPLADLRSRFPSRAIACAGNHGLEIDGIDFTFREPTAAARMDLLDRLVSDLGQSLADIPGAWVEHKGLSASVHYRQVAPHRVTEVMDCVHRLTSGAVEANHFLLRTGKAVLEIRPAVNWNKGHAVTWLISRLSGSDSRSVVFYLGDDDTDQDAFAVLPEGITVEVGPRPHSAARYHVGDSQDVGRFLSWLLAILERRGG